MGNGGRPASGYAISFGDGLIDMDLDVGEGFFEERVSLGEFGGAGEHGGGLGKAVSLSIGVEEFMDGGGAALIPYFVEPALDELFIGVAHRVPPDEERVARVCATRVNGPEPGLTLYKGTALGSSMLWSHDCTNRWGS